MIPSDLWDALVECFKGSYRHSCNNPIVPDPSIGMHLMIEGFVLGAHVVDDVMYK